MNTLTGLPRDKKDEVNRKFSEALTIGLNILRAYEPIDLLFGKKRNCATHRIEYD
jgi:hypothetical protein